MPYNTIMEAHSAVAIKNDLNLTGVFLQKTIFDSLVNTHGFGARREEPYSYRTAYGEHFTGTADILASIELPNTGVLTLVVECKRADELQKHWVFETRECSAKEPIHPFIFYLPPFGVHYAKRLILPSLGYNRDEDFEKAIIAFEFKEDKPDKRVLSRNSQENVYKSVIQAYEPLASLQYDTQSVFELAGTSSCEILFMPIVVTTANLSVMKYAAKDVDRASGTIDISKLELEPKKWVYYEFPLPESLRLEGHRTLDKSLILKYRPAKSPVFIVNSNAFDEFTKALINDAKTYVLPR